MRTPTPPCDRTIRAWLVLGVVAVGLAAAGCGMPSAPPGPADGPPGRPPRPGAGPGRREQRLALSPQQELALGRKVYHEILRKSRVLPPDSEPARRVEQVGRRIVEATHIRPLQREINLNLENYRFDWTFNVIQGNEVNAFCLPGGFVGVYTGLLRVAENDDQLATVMSHEIAHALAHHASERVARQNLLTAARRLTDEDLDALPADVQASLVQTLAPRQSMSGLAHDRFQELEADHIGVFLMAFSGYHPHQAVVFWQRMAQVSARRGQPPEFLSTHPSDERRIASMRQWAHMALAGKRAYDRGEIAPEAR